MFWARLPWRPFWLPVAFTTAVLLLAACGGSNGSQVDLPDSTPSPTEDAVAQDEASPSPDGESVAKDGDTVSVHYHGTLDTGEVFDSSRQREPLTFVLGSGGVISGFDDAVRGLMIGESVTVRLEPEQAYGEHREDLIFEVPLDQAPQGLAPGDTITLANRTRAVILEVTDEIVRIDANHRLAGQALTFEIELVSIR